MNKARSKDISWFIAIHMRTEAIPMLLIRLEMSTAGSQGLLIDRAGVFPATFHIPCRDLHSDIENDRLFFGTSYDETTYMIKAGLMKIADLLFEFRPIFTAD